MSPITPAIVARFDALLRDYGTRVRTLIVSHRLAQHGIDPDDIEQEVRIRLWRAVERDRNGVFHASYIQRIVLSVVVDSIRRAKVRVTEPLPDDESTSNYEDVAVAPEVQAGRVQHLDKVTKCLTEVPRNRRAALALHLQGYTWEEIAAVADISAEAARKLAMRGLTQLTARLAELGYGEFDED